MKNQSIQIRRRDQFSKFLTAKSAAYLLVAFCLAMPLSQSAQAATDMEKLAGTWQATMMINGKSMTFLWTITGNAYVNYVVTKDGNSEIGHGTIESADGKYKMTGTDGTDSGTLQFPDANTVVLTGQLGLKSTYTRKIDSATQP